MSCLSLIRLLEETVSSPTSKTSKCNSSTPALSHLRLKCSKAQRRSTDIFLSRSLQTSSVVPELLNVAAHNENGKHMHPPEEQPQDEVAVKELDLRYRTRDI